MAERKGFNFYLSYWEQMKLLNDKQKVKLLDAICQVQFLEKNINDISFSDNMLNLVWAGIKHSVSTSLNGFISKQKALNKPLDIPLSKGGAQQEEVQEEEKEQGKGQYVGGKPKRRNFIPPTTDQVKEYCLERKNNVDSQRFIDHYSSNGWMVGKNKMKDWKASVRTWEKSNFSNTKPKQTSMPVSDFSKPLTKEDLTF